MTRDEVNMWVSGLQALNQFKMKRSLPQRSSVLGWAAFPRCFLSQLSRFSDRRAWCVGRFGGGFQQLRL